ncbi:MAG: lipoyl synthase [Deltaproteobacteria bacterium]|nr:lipoyl synthase [Deltaproteobacteria bacterium]
MRNDDSIRREDVPGFAAAGCTHTERPPWLKQRVSTGTAAILAMMNDFRLNTVCLSASCPNIGECFGARTAAFLILGGVCTRNCRFCAVPKGRPAALDPEEPERLVQAAQQLGLRHVVITSVTRDDLSDGGAGQFAACIEKIRERCPGVTTEVLVPDFCGDAEAVDTVLKAAPEVFNHNVETVPSLYPGVRPGADYRRSLDVLHRAAREGDCRVKTGLMLGLGEEEQEVIAVFDDLVEAGVQSLTLGQYLRPSGEHVPVAEYIRPERFRWFEDVAHERGFSQVAAGPLVRSSYHAGELYRGRRDSLTDENE